MRRKLHHNGSMQEAFSVLLGRWQSFFVFVGGAAATLMGLLFVAISLGQNAARRSSGRARDTFVTPILTHFAVTVLLAALTLVPSQTPSSLGVLAMFVGAFQLVGLLRVLIGILEHHTRVDAAHWLWHMGLPFVSCLLLLAAGVGLLIGFPLVMEEVAACLLLHLLIGIRNAWKLTLWILDQEPA
jgi:hypothetical protein